MLHAWKAHGYDAASQRYLERYDPYAQKSEFGHMVAGRLAFLRDIRGVDDRIYRRLYGWARALEPSLFGELPGLSDQAKSLAEAALEFPAVSASDDRMTRRTYLRRLFASARGTLWVARPRLRIDAVRDLKDAIEGGAVQEVRLLSRERPPGRHGLRIRQHKRGARRERSESRMAPAYYARIS